ncbi:uncharacterized protein LOC123292779 [Chrysoperla carnea]|uniref:uncharacterized protein LOC123292779 n=1 Tax=Chrysoperla carnea TaxID=189513 RepID=UPI001D0906CB|nr:uncharacterized protein LOC123292779 [Chrysoperla carnea]
MGKQVKGGYLLRYTKNWLWKSWREEWVVLYEDSTLAWFKDKGTKDPRGYLQVNEAPELLANSEWTLRVPCRPQLPPDCKISQLIAVGTRRRRGKVHWLLAQSQDEVNDWMTAIRNTLPPPPKITFETDNKNQIIAIHNDSSYFRNNKNSSSHSRLLNVISPQPPSESSLPSYERIQPVNHKTSTSTTRITSPEPPPLPPLHTHPLLQQKHNSVTPKHHLQHGSIINSNSSRISSTSTSSSINNENHSQPRNAQHLDDYASGLIMGGTIFNWGHGLGWTTGAFSTNGMMTTGCYDLTTAAGSAGVYATDMSASVGHHPHLPTTTSHIPEDCTGFDDYNMDCALDFSF